jgi:hypothetical protein
MYGFPFYMVFLITLLGTLLGILPRGASFLRINKLSFNVIYFEHFFKHLSL